MSDVYCGYWENKLLCAKFNVIKLKSRLYFIGKQCAKYLGYVDTAYAIKNHIHEDEYKITVGDFLKSLTPSERRSLLSQTRGIPGFEFFHKLIGNRKNQLLITEHGLYELAFGSKLEYGKKFRKWVCNIISEIREKGYYCFPEVESLALEQRKETIDYVVNNDIPDFIPMDPEKNIERKDYHAVLKKGADKSKNLDQSKIGKIGGDKSSVNTIKARNFTREVASKEIEKDLDLMSQDDLYEYNLYLIHKSRDIIKDFKA